MAVGRSPAPAASLLRCILYSIVDRRSAFLVALSFYCLLSVAGIAADVQVNAQDHNVPDQAISQPRARPVWRWPALSWSSATFRPKQGASLDQP